MRSSSAALAVACLLMATELSPTAALGLKARKPKKASHEKDSPEKALLRKLVAQGASLGKALLEELGSGAGALRPALAESARGLLAREAGYLAAEDRLASELLRGLARDGLLPVLAAPAPGTGGAPEGEAFSGELQSVESTEMVVQRDAGGKLFQTIRHCQKGECVTSSKAVPEKALGTTSLLRSVQDSGEPSAQAQEDQEGADAGEEEEGGAESEEQAEEGEQEDEDGAARPAEEAADGPSEEADMGVQDQPDEVYSRDAEEEAEAPVEPLGEEAEAPVEPLGEEEQAEEEEEEERADLPETMCPAVDTAGPAVRALARATARSMGELVRGAGLESMDAVAAEVQRGGLMEKSDAEAAAGLGRIYRKMMRMLAKEGRERVPEGLADGAPLKASPVSEASESMSIVVSREDGRLLRRTRHCRSGRCTTESSAVDEIDPADSEDEASQRDEEA